MERPQQERSGTQTGQTDAGRGTKDRVSKVYEPSTPAVARPTSVRPSAPPPRMSSVYVKLTLVALFWGGTFIAGHVLASTLPHLVAATGRFLVACVLLLIAAWKVEGGLPRLSWRQALVTASLGVTGIFLYNVCFLGALEVLPAGRTALIVALNPGVTALAMARYRRTLD